MNKRQQQQQEEELQALRQRMEDMLHGALGSAIGHVDSAAAGADVEQVPFLTDEIDLGTWLGWVTVLERCFCASNGRDPEHGRVCPMYFERQSLHHLGATTLDGAAAHLYENGARADAEEIEL